MRMFTVSSQHQGGRRDEGIEGGRKEGNGGSSCPRASLDTVVWEVCGTTNTLEIDGSCQEAQRLCHVRGDGSQDNCSAVAICGGNVL